MCLLNFVLFFQVNYKCNYGETIYVVGNVPGLGNWSFQKGLKLTWSEGHNWTGKVKLIHDNREPIQYKYVIAPTDVMANPDNLIWERGSNHTIDLYSVSRLTIKLNDEWEHLKVRIAVSAEAFKALWNNSDEVLCSTNLPMRKSPVEMKLKKYSIQGDSKEELFWAASFYVPYNITSFNYKLRASNSETSEVYTDLSYRKFNMKKLPYYASLSEHYTVQCATHTKFDFKLSASFNFDAVTEDICVGSFPRTPQDIDELLANGVKAVLNLQTASDMRKFSIDWESLQQQYHNANITLEHFPIVDMDNMDLSKKVKEAGNLIEKLVKEHGKVYVHCTAGKYRSPHAVIFYLWYFKQYKLESAIELIRANRRKAKINIFEEVFKQGIQIAQRTM